MVRISNWSRDVLLTCGERSTSNRSIRVGSGTGPANDCTGTLCGLNDFRRRLIDQLVVESFETNTDFLVLPTVES